MSERSMIEWTDATWNPVTGCTKVSPGCDHCYAERFTERFRGQGSFAVVTRSEVRLYQPLRWRRPRRVFVNSTSDLFHDDIPTAFIVRVFSVMARTPQHTYQLLTKRHGRMRSLLASDDFWAEVASVARLRSAPATRYLPNVWIGVSAEDQQRAELRIPALLETPAAVRFVSAEPLLGPVDLTALRMRHGAHLDALAGDVIHPTSGEIYAAAPACLDWVIVGGESGPRARPMHPLWARDLRDQTTSRSRKFFFKQWGEWGPARHKVPIDPAVIDRYTANRADTVELDAAKRASEATGATHGYAVWAHRHGWEPHRYTHKPWSGERGHLDESTHASIRRWGKRRAGRHLDDRTWDDMPANHLPARG